MTARVRLAVAAVLAVFIALVITPGASRSAATPPVPIVRFHWVDDALYRGGQPHANGFQTLKALGIRTVVNLRHNDTERSLVEGLGLRYIELPTSLAPFGLSGGLPADVVQRFFDIVDDPGNRPVFVHCRRGADRTGTLVAMYRIARQGWSVEAAYDEARAMGLRWWHFPVKHQLERFAAGLRARAGASSGPARSKAVTKEPGTV